MIKRLCAAAVLAAVAGALVLAQSTNPLIGTWKLNVEKSKASFKSGTTVIEAAGKDGVKFTVDLVGTDGPRTIGNSPRSSRAKSTPLPGRVRTATARHSRA